MLTTLAIFAGLVLSQAQSSSPITEALAIGSVGTGGRVPISTNVIVSEIVQGNWTPPNPGDKVEVPAWRGSSRPARTQEWRVIRAAEDGWFSDGALRGGFAYVAYESADDEVAMLNVAGHSWVLINGEPRGGDPYALGIARIPFKAHRGTNHLLFRVGRGRLRVAIERAEGPVFLSTRDATLPDVIIGETVDLLGGVIVTNATEETWTNLSISAQVGEGRPVVTPIGDLPPLTSRKVRFAIPPSDADEPGALPLRLRLIQRHSREHVDSSIQFNLAVKRRSDLHKRTFVSAIDGSVQYYAVRPATSDTASALVLTAHGAGVEATGQAAAYSSKSWANIVAATNRRPFGFDWEDWGRLDALEVREEAMRVFGTDPGEVYLTGHSMGGHGAWYLGATDPDKWAAIGPAAGWISFWTYGGAVTYPNPDPIEKILLRVSNPSDITKIIRNYKHMGVFVLHGAEDRTVPIEQPRKMREYLAEFHRDVDFYEHPGGGHWYDSSDEPGTDCVDYGPMFDFFARRRIPSAADHRELEFFTTHPGLNATSRWATIVAQQTPYEPSSVNIRNDMGRRRFVGSTINVERLELDLSHMAPAENVLVNLDDEELVFPWPDEDKLRLQRNGVSWSAVSGWPASDKNPARAGPFKDAFRHNFLLVYGTQGTPEENAWSLAKARYDADTWWYRGNGRAEIVADKDFNTSGDRDRSVIVYGHADVNSAWGQLLADSPVQVRRGLVQVGGRAMNGEDLSIMMVRPRPGSDVASVGVVAGTGIVGMRSVNLMPYFVSGIHYPDLMVFDSSLHLEGSKGVRLAGFFGLDWSVANGDFAWRE